MLKKRFRSHRSVKIPQGIIIPVKLDKKFSDNDQTADNEYFLSDYERIRYIYSRNERGKISNIICVSYDIFIYNEWITIAYYDSEHGSLHRHEAISFEDRKYLITEDHIKKTGTKEEWLTWAINDLQRRNYYYLKLFLKRSNLNIDSLD